MTEIIVTDVSKVIRGKQVISNVSFCMSSGYVYGFQGINGSGKTMLMRLISGLIRPSKGEIRINGKILGKDMSFPDSIGVLLENPSFLGDYSGFKNLQMLASVKNGISDDKIEEAIKRVGLDPSDKKKYRKYSLGMKQRLGIACAVMERPDIVILDEPTNSLDTSGVKMLKEIVHQEKGREALVVLACHDLEILEELSDQILLLSDGCILDNRKIEKEAER